MISTFDCAVQGSVAGGLSAYLVGRSEHQAEERDPAVWTTVMLQVNHLFFLTAETLFSAGVALGAFGSLVRTVYVLTPLVFLTEMGGRSLTQGERECTQTMNRVYQLGVVVTSLATLVLGNPVFAIANLAFLAIEVFSSDKKHQGAFSLVKKVCAVAAVIGYGSQIFSSRKGQLADLARLSTLILIAKLCIWDPLRSWANAPARVPDSDDTASLRGQRRALADLLADSSYKEEPRPSGIPPVVVVHPAPRRSFFSRFSTRPREGVGSSLWPFYRAPASHPRLHVTLVPSFDEANRRRPPSSVEVLPDEPEATPSAPNPLVRGSAFTSTSPREEPVVPPPRHETQTPASNPLVREGAFTSTLPESNPVVPPPAVVVNAPMPPSRREMQTASATPLVRGGAFGSQPTAPSNLGGSNAPFDPRKPEVSSGNPLAREGAF